MKTKEVKCECDGTGVLKKFMIDWYDQETELPFVNHKPYECKCRNNLRQCIRNGKVIWLCSNCVLLDEEYFEKKEEKKNE